mmetsp:Transcript_28908/g.67291  ORF Transcript_28908/g.67291 Transcript_28908/m.67291 type:complete len:224 (+) Transcript_28908:422-1093(+)
MLGHELDRESPAAVEGVVLPSGRPCGQEEDKDFLLVDLLELAASSVRMPLPISQSGSLLVRFIEPLTALGVETIASELVSARARSPSLTRIGCCPDVTLSARLREAVAAGDAAQLLGEALSVPRLWGLATGDFSGCKAAPREGADCGTFAAPACLWPRERMMGEVIATEAVPLVGVFADLFSCEEGFVFVPSARTFASSVAFSFPLSSGDFGEGFDLLLALSS